MTNDNLPLFSARASRPGATFQELMEMPLSRLRELAACEDRREAFKAQNALVARQETP